MNKTLLEIHPWEYSKKLKELEKLQKNALNAIALNPLPWSDSPTKRDDKRGTRTWPYSELTSEQIEGMFAYGESMDYETPWGVLHIIPDPKYCMQFEDKRK